MSAGTRNG